MTYNVKNYLDDIVFLAERGLKFDDNVERSLKIDVRKIKKLAETERAKDKRNAKR